MPIKILLADKSITIQKVVEMLFSGKEYQVACVSDAETAFAEASRVVPDVVLADIDLPRLDGYTFSSRLKQLPALANTPVILMLSRDDVFDEAKARQASIVDHIAKPFESQELIGKLKKATATRRAEAAAPQAATAKPPMPPAAPVRPAAAVPPAPPKAPKQAPPTDIFDIIEDAPSQADLKRTEDVFEVEPVVEVEEQVERDMGNALPLGAKAVKEMREGLGLEGRTRHDEQEQDIVSFESLNVTTSTAKEYRPAPATPSRSAVPRQEAREYVPPPEQEDSGPASGIEPKLRGIAEEIVSRIAREHFKNMPAPERLPASEESVKGAVEASVSRIVREVARDVIEKVAWEVVPDLAAMLIKEEIERLKAET